MPRRLSKATAARRSRQARPLRARSLLVWLVVGWGAAVPSVLLLRAVMGAPEPPPLTAETLARVDAHVETGYGLLQAERHAEAYEEFLRAARLDPSDPRPYMGLGEASRTLNYDELAIEHYRLALARRPDFYAAKKSLTTSLCDFGRFEEALEVLDSMERQKPGDAFVWGERAVNLLRLGRAVEAVPLLERYNAAVGPQAWGYENLGRAHAEAGSPKEAEAAYRRALSIDPKTALTHLWLGQLLIQTDRRELGEEHLKTFRDLRTWQTRARLLEQAVNRSPDNVDILVRLSQARAYLGQYEKALIPLERAMRLLPQDERLRKIHGDLKARAGGPPR